MPDKETTSLHEMSQQVRALAHKLDTVDTNDTEALEILLNAMILYTKTLKIYVQLEQKFAQSSGLTPRQAHE